MKISRNPSRQGIRWRWRCMQLVALLTVSAAVLYPGRIRELIGAGVVLIAISYASKLLEEDLLIEVFDDGNRLRLAHEKIYVSVGLMEVEKITFKDGRDGMDIVTLSFLNATPWGQHVDFLPEPHWKFGGDIKLWFDDLEARILQAKANEASKVTGNAIENSLQGASCNAERRSE